MNRLKLDIQRFADGEIIIGTDLDTAKLEAKLNKLQRKLENEKVKLSVKEAELDAARKETNEIAKNIEESNKYLEEQKRQLDEVTRKYDKINQKIKDGQPIEAFEYYRLEGLQAEKARLEDTIKFSEGGDGTLEKQFDKALAKAEALEKEVEKQKGAVSNVNDELKVTNLQLEKANENTKGEITSLDKVGSSMQNIIHKVVKWGLAIFGIRSAYMFIRQAMGTLSQYDEQLATDVEYMRFALANALKPVIEAIVNLVYKLMAYVAYIAKAWFGINLFANATAKGFQKANKGAKELQKTLAGFDEMNILNADGSVGVLGTPSIDLSNLDNVEIPKWIKWIAENKNVVLSFFADMAALIATIKIASFLYNLLSLSKVLDAMSGLALFGMLAGIAITVMGIYETIRNLITWIGDPTWENFTKVLSGLETVLIGVGIAMVALNASNPVGWIITAVGVVGKFVGALFSEEEQLISTKEATKKLKEAQEDLMKANDAYVSAVERAEQAEKELEEAEKKHGISGKELYKQVQNGILDFKNMDSAQREVYKAYIANLSAQDSMKKATKELEKANKDATVASLNKKLAVAQETGEYDKLKIAITKAFNQGKISADEAKFYIIEAMRGMSDSAAKAFVQDIPADIMTAFDTDKYKGKARIFSMWWNGFINDLDKNIDVNVTATYTTKGKTKKNAKGALFYPSRLPKLAVGGIINQPGYGVPYNGAIIGERGAEAVVPLTDSQQMALLGETIGRYVNISATIPVYVGNRKVAREVRKIQANEDFAFNR